MSRLVTLALLSCLLTRVSCLISFINPPPFGTGGDFSGNPTYGVGSIVNIAWQGGEDGVGVSIVLYQLNQTNGQWFGDMEYLTQNALGATRYSWLVGTRKNVEVSNLFYLSAYQEGKGVSDTNSHYFNITGAKEAAVPTTSSTSPSSTSSTAESASSTTKSASSTTESASSTTESSLRTASLSTTLSSAVQSSSTLPTGAPTNVSGTPSPSSTSTEAQESFPTAAKIGLGVAIPAALILGIAAGFLLFRRHKKSVDKPVPMAVAGPPNELHAQSQAHEAGYYDAKPHEAPLMSPVELGYRGDPYGAYQTHQADGTANKNQMRYEM